VYVYLLCAIAETKPVRFQHIGLTAQTSLRSLLKLVTLRDLRTSLDALDDEIASLRQSLHPPSSPLRSINGREHEEAKVSPYEKVEDIGKLERLVKAREKTRVSLEGKVGWIGLEQARAEDTAEQSAINNVARP